MTISRLCCAAFLVAMSAPPLLPVAADEIRLDARALAENAVLGNVHRNEATDVLELDRGVLLEHDGAAAGYSYRPNEERLSATTWVKTEFDLAGSRPKHATLLVGPGGKLNALLNGKPLELGVPGNAGQYWQTYMIPPDALRPSRNEIILHGQGKVWIARDDERQAGGGGAVRSHLSARSGDAGKTWQSGLGPKGDIPGEYYVRLFLDQHQPRGSIRLPVLDLGNLHGRPVAAPLTALGPVKVKIPGSTSGETAKISVQVRTGPEPSIQDKHWTPWTTLTEGKSLSPKGRFLQVAIHLHSLDGTTSPRIEGVAIESESKVGNDWTDAVRILDRSVSKIVRSSIPFDYEPLDHPRLKELRTRYKLDDVVRGARDEMEVLGRLAAWTSQQWKKGHLKDTYPPWDALEILKPHADGTPVGGFCQQYNVVFLQACESFGFVGRAVSIGPGPYADRIRSGHEVVEIWSDQHQKWVYVDGQKAWTLVDAKSARPLSLLELRDRQLSLLEGRPAPEVRMESLSDSAEAWGGLESFPPFIELRLIPRSDFLARQAPLPLNQGMRGWFWTGHYAWTDERAPAAPLYGHRVRNARDWNWTLNQTAVFLEATDRFGEFRVHLDTETPGFDTFLARIDGGEDLAVSSGFTWRLRAGENHLTVRVRNRAGLTGASSWVKLAYTPDSR